MPGQAGEVTFSLRRNAAAFTHTFAEDTELSGPMNLKLWVSCKGTDDPSLFVGVEKWSDGRCVPFEGSYGYGRDRVATGRLRVALRELDAERSKPHQPSFGFNNRQPLAPGETVEVQIALSSSSTLFRAGESLRLLIGGRYLEPRNSFFGHFPAHYVPSPRGAATLHWGPDKLSVLEIPVIRPADAARTLRRVLLEPIRESGDLFPQRVRGLDCKRAIERGQDSRNPIEPFRSKLHAIGRIVGFESLETGETGR